MADYLFLKALIQKAFTSVFLKKNLTSSSLSSSSAPPNICVRQIRCKDAYPDIEFIQGNITDTDLPQGSYDAVIDKGLMDALFCTNTGANNVKQYTMEMDRMLSKIGVFITISHGNPSERIPHLEQYDLDEVGYTPWNVDVQAIPKPIQFKDEKLDLDDPESMYFIYVAVKSEMLVERKEGKALKNAQKAMTKKEASKKAAPQL